MIINLIGQPGSGKSSIAAELLKLIYKSINIDGDELRALFNNTNYSEDGRRANMQNAYNIAIFLESKGFVPILSLVSPYKDMRDSLLDRPDVYEFYLKTSDIRGREKFHVTDYEYPTNENMTLDTTGKNPDDMAKIIMMMI
jgi:adenylylsulfate kinase-like enzyme